MDHTQVTKNVHSYGTKGNSCKGKRDVHGHVRQQIINLDMFPKRKASLTSKVGNAAHMPQIFLNKKLMGGLVVINSLRNNGEFERRVSELAGRRCPDAVLRLPRHGHADAIAKTAGARGGTGLQALRVFYKNDY